MYTSRSNQTRGQFLVVVLIYPLVEATRLAASTGIATKGHMLLAMLSFVVAIPTGGRQISRCGTQLHVTKLLYLSQSDPYTHPYLFVAPTLHLLEIV